MSFLAKVSSFLSGGIGSKIVDKVLKQFPDKLSESEQAQIASAVNEATREHEVALMTLASQQDEEFNNRLKDLEGTSKDLQQFGFLGRVIVFLRGLQRPAWGFATLWMDSRWFFGTYEFDEQQQTALIVINTLVLGFLFGERAIKNLTPLIVQVFGKK